MNFKSNGKFLLTGEYLVLKGATALALPLKFGQSMDVETLDKDENLIYWNAYIKSTDNGRQTTDSETNWFSAVLNKTDFSIVSSDDIEKAERLSNILKQAKLLNNNIFTEDNDFSFQCHLDFNPQWGLGSSSTLISNISEWANVNPYQLLSSTFKGSGYDIACAKAEGPIFYNVNRQQTTDNGPIVRETDFNPPFKDNLYFIYRGLKQNSSNEVKAFLDKKKNFEEEVKSISKISEILPDLQTLRDFCYFIKIHEEIMSKCLEQKRLKKYFSDFEGEIKSLGAWGGDFFMAATEWDFEKTKDYFENKGLNVVLKYKDIVL
jgi:mevalonate kinase